MSETADAVELAVIGGLYVVVVGLFRLAFIGFTADCVLGLFLAFAGGLILGVAGRVADRQVQATPPPTLKPKTSARATSRWPGRATTSEGQVGARQRPVDVVGVSVPVEVGGDDLAGRGQAREQLAELQVGVEGPPCSRSSDVRPEPWIS